MIQQIDISSYPAVLINLDKDIEKLDASKKLLFKIGFQSIVRIPGTDAKITEQDMVGSPGKWQHPEYISACAKSFKDALSRIDPPFILFEDDITVSEAFSNLIQIPERADIVYLGGSDHGIRNFYTDIPAPNSATFYSANMDGIVIPKGMVTAHAVLVRTGKARDTLIKAINKYSKTIHDVAFAKLQFSNAINFYAINPPIFFQDGEDHTINPYHKIISVGNA